MADAQGAWALERPPAAPAEGAGSRLSRSRGQRDLLVPPALPSSVLPPTLQTHPTPCPPTRTQLVPPTHPPTPAPIHPWQGGRRAAAPGAPAGGGAAAGGGRAARRHCRSGGAGASGCRGGVPGRGARGLCEVSGPGLVWVTLRARGRLGKGSGRSCWRGWTVEAPALVCKKGGGHSRAKSGALSTEPCVGSSLCACRWQTCRA
jgi:hypothetical protein